MGCAIYSRQSGADPIDSLARGANKVERQDHGITTDPPHHPSELASEQHEAFEDMLEWVQAREHRVLTDKQRTWAEGVAEKLEIDVGDPSERNANVPKGRPVEMAPILKHLPKKPPGR